MIIVVITNM